MTSRLGTIRRHSGNLLAALLYGLAVVCSVLALLFGCEALSHLDGPNARMGDFTGISMVLSFSLGWLSPLAVSASLLAMLLRWPARSPVEEGRPGPDRRLMRWIQRAGRGPRTIVIVGLWSASLASAWTAVSFAQPGIESALQGHGAQLLVQNLLILGGPLVLLAMTCVGTAWRVARSGRVSAGP